MITKKNTNNYSITWFGPPAGSHREHNVGNDPSPGGMAAYPPMAMTAVCIMLEAERTAYRKMAGIPRNNRAMATKMGLTKSPPKAPPDQRQAGAVPQEP